MAEETLTNAICTLAGKIITEEEISQLKLILADNTCNVKERENALNLFDVLKESQKVTIEDVDIIYEILMLMGKNKFWTEFRKEVLNKIKVPDHKYDVKKNSKFFSKFRLMMVEIGNNLTSGMVNNLKTLYDVRGDFSTEWMFILHLERKIKVEQNNQRSLENFAEKLKSADCQQGAIKVERYVRDHLSSTQTTSKECDFKTDTSTDGRESKIKLRDHLTSTQTTSTIKECNFKTDTSTDGRESKIKCAVMKQVDDVKNKADGLLERVGNAKTRVEDTSKQCKKALNDLKKRINDCLEEYENGIDERKCSKLEELEKSSDVIRDSLENLSQLKINIVKAEAEKHLQSFAALESDVKEVEKTLNGVCPESVGYFLCKPKGVSNCVRDLKCIMKKQEPLYVDYKSVDPGHCKLNSNKLVKRCFDVGEIFNLKVDLLDSFDDVSRVEQEEASITVHIKDLIKSDDFKIIEQSVKYNIHEIKCMFASPGEWTVEVKVFGKVISEPFRLKVSPINNYTLKKVIKCEQRKCPAAVFDITFTADGQNLLACNQTSQVLLFDLSGNMKTFCELERHRKLVNLCCIPNGTVFLTDSKNQEIVVLEKEGSLKRSFGKSHFPKSSPQGIAAIMKDNRVHVFTSNHTNECLDYFIDGEYTYKIKSLGDTRQINNPWFLAVNSNFQLFICNTSDGYLVDVLDMTPNPNPKKRNYKLVHSIVCDSSVCVDEKDNIFLGNNSEILMYKSDFTFVQRFKFKNKSVAIFGLAARSGHLAVVHPGEIILFSY